MALDYIEYLKVNRETYKLVGSEPCMIYCCADGSLTYAPYGDSKSKPIKQALPVLTVQDADEAERIITMVGSQSFMLDDPYSAKYPGGPESRYKYSLPDFQFNNEKTLCNVTQMLHDVRQAWLGKGDMAEAFSDAHARAGRFFEDKD